MAGVNKVILIGNLGKDPELRRTPSGASVASFSLATTERYTDKNGQRQDQTEWHNIVAWGKLAELANQYLKKGRSAYIEGRIQTRSWDDKDGNKRSKTEINASQIQFLGSPSGQGPSKSSSGEVQPPPSDDYSMPEPAGDSGSAPRADTVAEDDLPF